VGSVSLSHWGKETWLGWKGCSRKTSRWVMCCYTGLYWVQRVVGGQKPTVRREVKTGLQGRANRVATTQATLGSQSLGQGQTGGRLDCDLWEGAQRQDPWLSQENLLGLLLHAWCSQGTKILCGLGFRGAGSREILPVDDRNSLTFQSFLRENAPFLLGFRKFIKLEFWGNLKKSDRKMVRTLTALCEIKESLETKINV
jgi:hypothetical protein